MGRRTLSKNIQMAYGSPICDSRKIYDLNSLVWNSKFLSFWLLSSFLAVSRPFTLDHCSPATTCGSLHGMLFLIFGNLSSSFKSVYTFCLTQQYRHSELCVPIESSTGSLISMYHILLWVHLHASFPTRLRAPWRQKVCLICLCIFIRVESGLWKELGKYLNECMNERE